MVYMLPLSSFVDKNSRQVINWDTKVHDLIDQDKEWNLHSINKLLPTDVLADIKAVPIPSSPLEDRFGWGFSQDGTFTLKSATWTMRKPSSHPRSKMLNQIWKLKLLPKIKFFLLLVIRNSLPTCEFLVVRRIEIPNVYHFYSHNIENIDHIFRECPFVQGIWDNIKYNCPTPLFYEGDFLS